MATPVTDAFIAQIRGAAVIMGGAQVDAMEDAGKAIKPVMEAAVVSMAGPDMRLRNNTTKSGSPKGGIKVRSDVQDLGAAGAQLWVRATGPIALIEKGAPPHEIKPRRSRRKRGVRVAINTPDGPRAKVNHPGSRGKGRWAQARDTQVPPVARAAFVLRNATAFRKAFS